MKLAVIIVNFRTPGLTIDCLASLVGQLRDLGGARAIVVENGSGDDSAARIAGEIEQNAWSDVVKLIDHPDNGGFAGGNNVGLRQCRDAEFVLLLNPDTIVRPDAVASLLRFMHEHPDVGITGSRLEDPDGTAQRSAFRFHTIASEFEQGINLGLVSRCLARFVVAPPPSQVPCATDWVAGASMMIRRDVLERIGLLDENYFMYFEEVDWCLRASRAGFTCWYVPQSRVVHLVGQASGVTAQATRQRRRPGYWFESRRRYFIRNHGRLYAMAADLAWLSGHALWRLRCLLQRKQREQPQRLMRDFLKHSALHRGCPC